MFSLRSKQAYFLSLVLWYPSGRVLRPFVGFFFLKRRTLSEGALALAILPRNSNLDAVDLRKGRGLWLDVLKCGETGDLVHVPKPLDCHPVNLQFKSRASAVRAAQLSEKHQGQDHSSTYGR
jgi:hypothetical protein